MHDAVRRWVAQWATNDNITVVEIGSQDMNGSVRDMFPNADYWGIDVAHGVGVDEVADGATWQPSAPVDLVVSCEVFEHAENWRSIVANAVRMLKPGGRFVCTAAGPGRGPHSGRRAGPIEPDEFYENVKPDDLRAVMDAAGFVDVAVDVAGADVRAVGVVRE